MTTNFDKPPEKPIKKSSAKHMRTAADVLREKERVSLNAAVFAHMRKLNPAIRTFDDDTFKQARDEVFRTRGIGQTGSAAERTAEFMRQTKSVKSGVIKLWHSALQEDLPLAPKSSKAAWLLADARNLQGREQKRAGETYKSLGLVEPQAPDVFDTEDDES